LPKLFTLQFPAKCKRRRRIKRCNWEQGASVIQIITCYAIRVIVGPHVRLADAYPRDRPAILSPQRYGQVPCFCVRRRCSSTPSIYYMSVTGRTEYSNLDIVLECAGCPLYPVLPRQKSGLYTLGDPSPHTTIPSGKYGIGFRALKLTFESSGVLDFASRNQCTWTLRCPQTGRTGPRARPEGGGPERRWDRRIRLASHGAAAVGAAVSQKYRFQAPGVTTA
jgi:hypothetical protein